MSCFNCNKYFLQSFSALCILSRCQLQKVLIYAVLLLQHEQSAMCMKPRVICRCYISYQLVAYYCHLTLRNGSLSFQELVSGVIHRRKIKGLAYQNAIVWTSARCRILAERYRGLFNIKCCTLQVFSFSNCNLPISHI